LPLAARHSAHRLTEALRKPRKQRQHAFQILSLARPGTRRISAELEVLAHRQVGEDAAALGHQRDAGFDDMVLRQRQQVALA